MNENTIVLTNDEWLYSQKIVANAAKGDWYKFWKDEVLQRREEILAKLKYIKKEDSIFKVAGELAGFDKCATIFEEFIENVAKEESAEKLEEPINAE